MIGLDTISIELGKRELGQFDDAGKPVLYEFISLVINGAVVPGEFDDYAFVLSTLNHISDVTILTCSCGSAGCAGIFHGTRVKNRRRTVEWRDIDSGLPKKFYSFDRAQYTVAVEEVKKLWSHVSRYGDTPDEYEVDRRLDWMREHCEWYTLDNQCGVREMRRQREISQIKMDEYYRSM